ncbi:hypothetical protein HU71_004806 [Salmonella enterica subsp. enterica]|nr:hypothetical protein [Salmonella enterica subsp. enterica]
MATVLTPDSDLLSVPFSAATEFTELADHCDRFAWPATLSSEPDTYYLLKTSRFASLRLRYICDPALGRQPFTTAHHRQLIGGVNHG